MTIGKGRSLSKMAKVHDPWLVVLNQTRGLPKKKRESHSGKHFLKEPSLDPVKMGFLLIIGFPTTSGVMKLSHTL